MSFIKHRPLISVSLLGVALSLTGCLKDGDSITQNSDNDSTNSLFDNGSGQMDSNPWNVPYFGLVYHNETNSSLYDVQDAAVNSARPGAVNRDLLADRTIFSSANGDSYFQPAAITNGSGDANFRVITRSVTNFLNGAGSGDVNLARGIDNAIYQQNGSGDWVLSLPKSVDVGTAWTSPLDFRNTNVGQVYLTKNLGTVSYRPKIRSKVGSLLTSESPDLFENNVAVDLTGIETAVVKDIAIDYSTGTGYKISAVNVRRNGRFVVTQTDAATPGDTYTGCIKVSLVLDYRAVLTANQSFDTIIGLDQFSGNYTLYWKPGTGWVYWTGTENLPAWSFDSINPPLNLQGPNTLSGYNFSYDLSYFDGAANTYRTAWRQGFVDAYRDLSTATPSSNRKTLTVGIEDYRIANNTTDRELVSDSLDDGAAQGLRDASDPGYTAGYNLGTSYYGVDFTAVASGADTLAAGATNRSASVLQYNKVPATFRPDGEKYVTNVARYEYQNGLTPTGGTYSNAYDGKGNIVIACDPSVTTDPNKIRSAKDIYNQDVGSVYISLPVVGRIVTSTVTGTAAAIKITGTGTSN